MLRLSLRASRPPSRLRWASGDSFESITWGRWGLKTCRRSIAESRRAFVADPLPHRGGALQLGAGDQRGFVELLGVEADRTDVVAPTGSLVALHEVGQRRAAVAGDTHRDAVERESDGFLGEEHERGSAGLGRADPDQECDGDLL